MEMSRKFFTYAVFGFVLLAVACVKPSGVSRQNQAPKKVQDKAMAEYKIAEASFQQGHMAQALSQFQLISKQYYNTTSADNALLRIAQIYKREKNMTVAQSTLKKLVDQYPDSDIRYQAFRELTAISIQQGKFEEALNYMVDIDLKKLTTKELTSMSSAAKICIEKTKRDDLALLWNISLTDVNTSQDLKNQITTQIGTTTDKSLLERIMNSRQTQFPALEASLQRYKISKDGNDSDQKKWAMYIVEHFPTSGPAQDLRAEISEPIPFKVTTGQYNIGVLLPLTGDQQSYGVQALNGIKTAFEIAKQNNPSLNVQYFVEDIGLGGDAAKQALQKLINENQIIAVIGPLSSKDTESIAEIAQVNNLPVISLSPAENVTTYGTTIFRNSITKKEQAVALSLFLAKTMGIRRAAILYPNNTYGKEFMELFWSEYVKLGGEIRGAEEYNRNASDYEMPIKKLVGLWQKDLRRNELCSKSQTDVWYQTKRNGGTFPSCYPIEELPPITDFEAIFVPDSYDKARQILPTLLFYDIEGVQVVGTNLWNTQELLAGSIGNEMEGAVFFDGFLKNNPSPQFVSFMQKYYALFNAEPGILEAQGYDSTIAIFQTILKKNPASREAMTRQLTKISDIRGVTGLMQFSDKHEAIRNMVPLIVDQNKIVELK